MMQKLLPTLALFFLKALSLPIAASEFTSSRNVTMAEANQLYHGFKSAGVRAV